MQADPEIKLEAPASAITKREARITAILFALCGIYVLSYSASFGYGGSQTPTLLWGIPTWVVWGILAPWVAVTLFTAWFAVRFMRDEDMGEERVTVEDAANE